MPQPLVNVRTDSQGRQWISAGELTESIFGPRRVISPAEQARRYFGSALSPQTIETVLHAATFGGHMQGLSDLLSETLSLDPTFSMHVQKRTAALASVEPMVVPAKGDEVDDTMAALLAKQLTQELAGIREFRARITSLSWAHFSGRAALEKEWRENSLGEKPYQWSLAGLNWIHNRRLSFGPAREIRVRDSRYSGGGFTATGFDIESVPHKFICFTPQLFDEYPEREGYGPRGSYWAFFKRFTQAERNAIIEIFGRPWRIIESDQTYDQKVLDDLQARVDECGAGNSVAMPRGVTVKTDQPNSASTDPHAANIEDCNKEIAKLVLWNTRTTESAPAGLGSSEAAVHQDGETLAIAGDGMRISEVLSYDLARDWVVLNYGESEAVNAPRIVINYTIPESKGERTNRLKTFVEIGAPVLQSEAYEAAGFTVPQEGDEVLQAQAQPAPAADVGGLGGSAAAPLAATQTRALRLLRLSRQSSS